MRCGGSEEITLPCSQRHDYGCGGPDCDEREVACPGCPDCTGEDEPNLEDDCEAPDPEYDPDGWMDAQDAYERDLFSEARGG